MANRVKVLICNSEYVISSNEDPEYVRDIAYRLDETIKELMLSDNSMSVTKALVLCSLSFLDEANKSERSADNLRAQIKEYLDDSSSARDELDELKRELSAHKKENQQLKAQLLEFSMPDQYKQR